jgi:hypothetical protein
MEYIEKITEWNGVSPRFFTKIDNRWQETPSYQPYDVKLEWTEKGYRIIEDFRTPKINKRNLTCNHKPI